MALGILNNISAIYAENNLNNTQASLQKVLQELSSGSRINSGADDAAGLAIANGLKSNEAALTQSTQNASDAIGLLQTADGALSQVTGLLTRAVTLATEAANGTLGTSQVSSANQEYQSIIAEIGNIGGTTNFNGVNVFGTTATTFYVGDGTQSGSTFFADTVGALTTGNVGLSAGSAAAPVAATITASNSATTSLQTIAIAHAGDTLSGTLSFTDGATPSKSFNLTLASGTTFAQLKNLVAANGGVVDASSTTTSLVFAGGTGEINSNLTGNLVDTQNTVAATAGTAAASSGTGTFATISLSSLNSATDSLVGTLSVTLGTSTAGSASTTLSTVFGPNTTLAQAINQVNGSQTFLAAGVTAVAVGNSLVLKGPAQTAAQTTAGVTNSISLSGTAISDTVATAAAGVGTSLAGSTLTTASAATVLATVNSAISNVSYQRGIIGAYSNQLTAASNTAASENVNLTAAESSLRSTNYGQATSDLAKFEVLSQTGISALAQANTVQQEILKLLQ